MLCWVSAVQYRVNAMQNKVTSVRQWIYSFPNKIYFKQWFYFAPYRVYFTVKGLFFAIRVDSMQYKVYVRNTGFCFAS